MFLSNFKLNFNLNLGRIKQEKLINLMMKKTLSVSDIILLSIAGVFDFFQEIKNPGGLISNYYQNFYGFVPQRWQKVNIYKTIHINRKKNRLAKINKKLFLTPEGEKYLKNRFPSIFLKMKKWDGYLYFVFFDVAELKRHVRDYLRSLLKQINFAQLQKSVWITFNKKIIKPILKFKKTYHLNKEIIIIKAKFQSQKQIPKLINQLWRLNDINQKYHQIFLRYQGLLTKYIKEKNLFSLINEFGRINKDFYQIIRKDPFLPRSLLPKKWYYFESLKMKRKIAKIIKIKNKNI